MRSYIVYKNLLITKTQHFKTYDELKEKLNKVLTGTSVGGTVVDYQARNKKFGLAEDHVTKRDAGSPMNNITKPTDDDETLDYFAKLADNG